MCIACIIDTINREIGLGDTALKPGHMHAVQRHHRNSSHGHSWQPAASKLLQTTELLHKEADYCPTNRYLVVRVSVPEISPCSNSSLHCLYIDSCMHRRKHPPVVLVQPQAMVTIRAFMALPRQIIANQARRTAVYSSTLDPSSTHACKLRRLPCYCVL